MTQPFLPFVKPSISEAAIEEVSDSIRSGWLTTGPKVKRFEAALAEYVNAPTALTVSSATAGLHLVLAAMELSSGDEVITTPLTFVATANSIVAAGARPRFVDVDPKTFNLDINQVESAINERTRAIMPVHFAGLSVDLDPLYELAKKHNLRVIEDAAHAIGSDYKNQKIGSFGDIQVFSFHPNKNMTTGEGGAIICRDEKLAKKIQVLRFHGIDREAWNRFSKEGSQDYEVVAPGFKYNMMDIQAALGLHQLPELDGFIRDRAVIAERYLQELANWREWQLPENGHYENLHAWHIFTPLIQECAGMSRDQFVDAMKAHNIGIGVHWPRPVHLYAYYRESLGHQEGDFPHAENIMSRIVSLPMFPGMTSAEQDRVITAMNDVFKR
ncbi:DegT/DnrJ/EryC1/StrS family aminotransferase [Piscirickettsia litoralis]|uniref:UDP-4-amino-4, 6-dideoxy-N-acetyl-beta-L-altrosamine transaminase n=1 Tax=Piscirickettsia litoralis TaxID=1891921 RepID=A0ABX3A1B6_9GAMM|nr:DegT/DnrJ/EryC1/StrS family aminotransferase [Piscirickettsia litoralis]ODN42429.1 UDP-4-amino-4,6-dideoxy-N-acetyl-beta-L-altrosamine transaminase [Piscirickettsia litoralis]